MVKLIVTVWRRSDFSQAEFIARWKDAHGPLVLQHAPALRIRRYVQSHPVVSAAAAAFASGRGWAPPCDGLTEIWWDSVEDFEAGFASPEGQIASAILQADEERFVEMSKVTAFLSTENVVLDHILANDQPRSKA